MTKESIKAEADDNKANIVGGLNINDIVKKAQSMYDKSEKGLAKTLSTGINLNRAAKESDFILWEDGDLWKDLTGTVGLMFGRCTQVCGLSNAGKSSLAAQFMVYAQRQNCFVILWDSEQKFAASRFRDHMGGDPSKLLIVDTNSILDGCKGIAYYIKTIKEAAPKAKILVVCDSIGAAINSSENNEEEEDMSRQPGAAAKEVSFMLRKLMRLINQYQDRETNEHNIAVLCINQVYAKIGFMQSGYAQKGGATLEYLSSLIIMLSRKKDLTKIKGGKKLKYGIVSKAKVQKNHLFDGNSCLAEVDVVVDAAGIRLADEVKNKDQDVQGWNEKEDEDSDEE